MPKGERGERATPDFGISVNPIQTRGQFFAPSLRIFRPSYGPVICMARRASALLVSKKKQKLVVIKLAERSTPFSCWIERDRVGKKTRWTKLLKKWGHKGMYGLQLTRHLKDVT